MRKLLTAVVAGALAASLGTPAFGNSRAAQRSADQITATVDWGEDSGGGRYRRGYGSAYDSGGFYDSQPGRRRDGARQRECNDAYSYDRTFYNRYCRGGSAGAFRSSEGYYPDSTSVPADLPAPAADPTAPAPDQVSSPAPGLDAPPAPDGAGGHQSAPPGGPASPAPGPPGSERFRNPATRPPWAGYGTGAPSPPGPPGPVGVSY